MRFEFQRINCPRSRRCLSIVCRFQWSVYKCMCSYVLFATHVELSFASAIASSFLQYIEYHIIVFSESWKILLFNTINKYLYVFFSKVAETKIN